MLDLKVSKIGVIGLGYVGLPIAVSFSKYFNVVGFDKKIERINQLNQGIDITNELSPRDLKKSKTITFSYQSNSIQNCNIYIVTVPTPINKKKIPNLSFLKQATKLVGKFLSKGNIVIFESTVYPGTTEEICIPILEKTSSLKLNKDFSVSYSPERINPGDKKHKISDIVKVVSASNDKTLNQVKDLYSKIVNVGVYCAENIRIAEAAKVIENIQRDINIALINEFSIIFNKLNIDTYKVLEAAKTKWNFLEFYPGLVGGHCIGVDPYYLTYKSLQAGYDPKLILSGRNINEKMPMYVTKIFLKKLFAKFNTKNKLKVLVLGISFKENCPDVRNSKVFDIVKILRSKKVDVDVYDPVVAASNEKLSNNISLEKKLKLEYYNGIIIAVAHNEFKKMGLKKIMFHGKKDVVVFDVKNLFKRNMTELTL